ncbi:MAG: hypothetical protein GXY71_06940, partial [Treponema sp.]|nr:hypothetical protein [Treponema sp.]
MVRKSARWILAILIALTFAGILSLFALPRMRTLLESKLESAVYSLQERLYEQTGLRLGYSYASVVLPYRISFYGVEVFRETRSESAILRRKLLAASEIRLRLDPWAAIFGTPAELLKHAEIGDLDIDLQFPDDQDTLKKITTLFSSDTPGALPRLVIDITGMSASLTQADLRRYSASLSSFQLSTLSGAPEAIIPTALLFIADPAFGENELFIQATMFELRSEADLSRLSASAEVAARLGEIQLASQAMTFEVSSGAFVARAAGMGYELELGYGYGSKEFRGEVKLRGLRPSG